VSPADPWSISDTLYVNATQAVNTCIASIANISPGTGGGPFSRQGLNSYRTLASLYHDQDLTYFAWDDFTPGQPQSVNVTTFGISPTDFIITWAPQYANDLNGQVRVQAQLERSGFGTVASLNTLQNAGPLSEYNWTVTGLVSGTYNISVQLAYYDAIITTNLGATGSRDIFGILVIP
jgi:hypothetical protein